MWSKKYIWANSVEFKLFCLSRPQPCGFSIPLHPTEQKAAVYVHMKRSFHSVIHSARLQSRSRGLYEMKLFHGPSRSTTSGKRIPRQGRSGDGHWRLPRRSASTEGGGV
ncbi:unnamed protein product [Boreogadus saida]